MTSASPMEDRPAPPLGDGRKHWFSQLWRYGVVGLGSNALLYLLYLLLTTLGMAPVPAFSLLYAVGVVVTFTFNRRWSFASRAGLDQTFWRYFAAYAIGYVFNFLLLHTAVHRWGWPHQAVQAAAIVLTAGLLFLLQRYWVFARWG